MKRVRVKKWLNWSWALLYAAVLTVTVTLVARSNHGGIEEETAEKTTLTFRHFWIAEHDRPMLNIFEDVVRQYESSHPNVKVNFEGMDQTIHREQKLKSEMVTGTPPDMFVLFGGAEIEPYIRSNRLMDLTEFVKNNHLEKEFKDLKLWTYNQRIYGLPIEGNAEPLYVNTEIFNKLGLALPETLTQLNEAVKVLKENGYIPFALGNEDRWPAAVFAHYLMDRFSGPNQIDGIVQGEAGAVFDNGGYLKAFEQLAEWGKEGAFGPSPNSLSTEEAIDLFTHGKAAMYLNGNWDITLFHNEKAPPEFQDKVGVLPFPALHPGGERSIAGGYTFGIGLSSNLTAAQQKAALELMQSFYSEDVQKRIVYEGLRIPSMRIDFDTRQTGAVFTQVTGLMEQPARTFAPYDNILSPEVKWSFLAVVEEVINGQTAPGDALVRLDDSLRQYWNLRRSSAAK
ncbi:extracellular solute-binding protein [Paenibacillus sp. VCA1]|uniref:ABC transporter substrate-binding protein n=1 Tax=Paenibacillus sp. VCA1 TaxID=3039148 RepID=UPI00287237DA|nr:extracellular solute-binding protein [Paenibacillus sp. VCA1]MDR9852619.1 extracellular solute-binding protein [Paenibacillus sp. VCA1]